MPARSVSPIKMKPVRRPSLHKQPFQPVLVLFLVAGAAVRFAVSRLPAVIACSPKKPTAFIGIALSNVSRPPAIHTPAQWPCM